MKGVDIKMAPAELASGALSHARDRMRPCSETAALKSNHLCKSRQGLPASSLKRTIQIVKGAAKARKLPEGLKGPSHRWSTSCKGPEVGNTGPEPELASSSGPPKRRLPQNSSVSEPRQQSKRSTPSASTHETAFRHSPALADSTSAQQNQVFESFLLSQATRAPLKHAYTASGIRASRSPSVLINQTTFREASRTSRSKWPFAFPDERSSRIASSCQSSDAVVTAMEAVLPVETL
mmetsp:Transcript_162/g.281  ORF Transcript_162/g.281 Transcript_162/m.281 type:complete len:236 (+) Transcript_162:122-829(+)